MINEPTDPDYVHSELADEDAEACMALEAAVAEEVGPYKLINGTVQCWPADGYFNIKLEYEFKEKDTPGLESVRELMEWVPESQGNWELTDKELKAEMPDMKKVYVYLSYELGDEC